MYKNDNMTNFFKNNRTTSGILLVILVIGVGFFMFKNGEEEMNLTLIGLISTFIGSVILIIEAFHSIKRSHILFFPLMGKEIR